LRKWHRPNQHSQPWLDTTV